MHASRAAAAGEPPAAHAGARHHGCRDGGGGGGGMARPLARPAGGRGSRAGRRRRAGAVARRDGAARRPVTAERTFGLLRLEILAALVNGATLIVIALCIGLEASRRLHAPAEVQGALLLIIAGVGLAANAVGTAILHRGHDHSLKLRGAYLHIVSDLLGSVGALLAGVIILATGWVQADPVISVLISLLILGRAWRLVKESTDVLL